MPNWKELSADDRWHIENDLMWALRHAWIWGALTRWVSPSKLPHWQLAVQTSWCKDKPPEAANLALEQAMERAGITAPKHAITLCAPPTGGVVPVN